MFVSFRLFVSFVRSIFFRVQILASASRSTSLVRRVVVRSSACSFRSFVLSIFFRDQILATSASRSSLAHSPRCSSSGCLFVRSFVRSIFFRVQILATSASSRSFFVRIVVPRVRCFVRSFVVRSSLDLLSRSDSRKHIAPLRSFFAAL